MPLEFKPTSNPKVSECVVKHALLRIEETDEGFEATARRAEPPTNKAAARLTLDSHEHAAEWLGNFVNQSAF